MFLEFCEVLKIVHSRIEVEHYLILRIGLLRYFLQNGGNMHDCYGCIGGTLIRNWAVFELCIGGTLIRDGAVYELCIGGTLIRDGAVWELCITLIADLHQANH